MSPRARWRLRIARHLAEVMFFGVCVGALAGVVYELGRRLL